MTRLHPHPHFFHSCLQPWGSWLLSSNLLHKLPLAFVPFAKGGIHLFHKSPGSYPQAHSLSLKKKKKKVVTEWDTKPFNISPPNRNGLLSSLGLLFQRKGPFIFLALCVLLSPLTYFKGVYITSVIKSSWLFIFLHVCLFTTRWISGGFVQLLLITQVLCDLPRIQLILYFYFYFFNYPYFC